MLASTLVLIALALALVIVNMRKGKQMEGLKEGGRQFVGVLPILLLAFILAGMLEALIPEEFVQGWLSREAGLRGVVLGTIGGMALAMGPYASFPIIASIYGAGAGLGTVISLIAGWTLLGLSRLPFEVGILGLRFTLTRMAMSVPFCLAVGAAAHFLEILLLN